MAITEYLVDRYKKHLSVLNTFDKVINESLWQQSKFLNAVSSEVKILRDFFDETLSISDGYLMVDEGGKIIKNDIDRTGYKKVYVILENDNITGLESWVPKLKELVVQVTTKPVYKIETDAKGYITKSKNFNIGYAVIYVKHGDIQVIKGEVPRDEFENELLRLKDHAIQEENIDVLEFDQAKYLYIYGRLFLNF